jgi:hypothetical protein
MQDQACSACPAELRATMTWQQISDWLKKRGGTITSIIVIFGALFAGIRYIVSSEVADIRSDVATLKGDAKTLDDKLGATNQRIDGLLKDALERAFPKPSPTATKAELKEDFKRVSDLLQFARSENIRLDPLLVSDYGKKVVSLSTDPAISGAAWLTLTALLDYRSFLNVPMAPSIPNPVSGKGKFSVEFRAARLPNTSEGMLGVTFSQNAEMVTGSQAALFIEIGHEGKVVQAPKEFVVEARGFNVELDNYHVRNAVIRDAKITYNGGPLILENVYFVNCTFEIRSTSSSQLFANAILEHVPATFDRS